MNQRSQYGEVLSQLVSIMEDEKVTPRDRARARALWYRMTEGSGNAAAISVGSGFIMHKQPKPEGAGWAEHNAIQDGDG